MENTEVKYLLTTKRIERLLAKSQQEDSSPSRAVQERQAIIKFATSLVNPEAKFDQFSNPKMSRRSFHQFKTDPKSKDYITNAHAEAALFVLNSGPKLKVVVTSEVSTLRTNNLC